MTSVLRFVIVLLLAAINSISPCKAQATDGSTSVYFKINSSVLDQEHKRQLSQWLANNKSPIRLTLKGFTDTTGNSAHNLTLSMSRAKAVASFIKKFSNDYVFAAIRGLGEDSLLDRSLLWQNRRVVVEVVFNPKPFVPIRIEKDSNSSVRENNKVKGAEKVISKALDNIYFIPDKPVLEEVSLYYLNDLASALLQYPPSTSFEIVGHVHCMGKSCDDPGLKKINDELSVARAKELYTHLIERGVAVQRLSYRGVGSQGLAYPHPKTEEEARKNMRVEIVVHW